MNHSTVSERIQFNKAKNLSHDLLGAKNSRISFMNGTASLLGCSGPAQRRMFFSRGKDTSDNEKLYDVLEVPKTASEAEIRKSFFNLAKKYHPDVNNTKEAKQKYLDITEAYETLSDPKKRRIYDAYGMNANEQNNSEINFDQFGSFANVLKAVFRGDVPGDGSDQARHRTYDEILEEYEKFFSLDEEMIKSQEKASNKRGTSSKKGSNSTGTNCFLRLDVDFAESIVGVQRYVNYQRMIRCGTCKGERVQ